MTWFLFFLLPIVSFAGPQVESFVIQIQDRSMTVLSPDKKSPFFTVLVENRSLSDQVGKFTVGGKTTKYLAIPSGKSESVQIDNKSYASVFFIPVSPAFQDVELQFGKKAYEIPPKE